MTMPAIPPTAAETTARRTICRTSPARRTPIRIPPRIPTGTTARTPEEDGFHNRRHRNVHRRLGLVHQHRRRFEQDGFVHGLHYAIRRIDVRHQQFGTVGRGDDHHAEWFDIHEPESDAERFESQWHIIRHVRQWDGHFEIAYEACGRGFPRPRARHAANCMILLCVVSYTRFAEQTLGLWRSW